MVNVMEGCLLELEYPPHLPPLESQADFVWHVRSLGQCVLWLVSLPAPACGRADQCQSKLVKGQGEAAPTELTLCAEGHTGDGILRKEGT